MKCANATGDQSTLKPLPLNASVCILSARRFGDAIINANALKEAAKIRPDINWIIWTKSEFIPLFKLMGFNNIVAAEFPIAGGTPKLIKGGWGNLLKSIKQLRKLHIDASIDFIGDTREVFLGKLIGARNHYSPCWSSKHWMHHLIWHTRIPMTRYLPVHANVKRVYEFIPSMLSKILGATISVNEVLTKFILTPTSKVAFHPYSSQSFKQWPTQNWLSLAEELDKHSITPFVLCSPAEEKIAREQFDQYSPLISIVSCNSLESLITKIQSVDLLIGVDSFLVHLASALGKPTVVLNAGNLPEWWAPPNSIAIGQSGGCDKYPCFNEPSCLGKPNESACIRSITPSQVMTALESIQPKTGAQ